MILITDKYKLNEKSRLLYFNMKIKLLVFLKQTIRSIIICFWKTFLDQKEVYDQTIRTSLIITGFIESLIKDK